MRHRLAISAGLAALCAGSLLASARAESAPPTGETLVGIVGTGDASVISLTLNGAAVTELPPGEYTIQVEDRSAFHNFHLSGPGVDQTTTVDFVGTVQWTVTLGPGAYAYECDPHTAFMRGEFSVPGAPPPPPPPPPSPPPPPPPPPPAPPPPATAPMCTVPRVVGRPLVAAQRSIRRARCQVGRIRRARSSRPIGRVVAQTPRAGRRVARGTRVALVVSRGRH